MTISNLSPFENVLGGLSRFIKLIQWMHGVAHEAIHDRDVVKTGCRCGGMPQDHASDRQGIEIPGW
jgi:hypothetical protein